MDSSGNPTFPLCDVAQYLPYYVQPGATGTTYIYAHARNGMLLSLLDASEVDDGSALVGQTVTVYTSAGWRFDYAISIVKRHVTDYVLADEVAPGQQRLIVQTSEGLADDPNKLQVAAAPVASEQIAGYAAPPAAPRACAPT
jgi:hypothetical protein